VPGKISRVKTTAKRRERTANNNEHLKETMAVISGRSGPRGRPLVPARRAPLRIQRTVTNRAGPIKQKPSIVSHGTSRVYPTCAGMKKADLGEARDRRALREFQFHE
jgi:hypothetical protein